MAHILYVCAQYATIKMNDEWGTDSKITDNKDVPFKHYNHALARMMCNPPLLECHLGSCKVCAGREPVKELLSTCLEEMEIEKIEYKQWTNTDRS